MSGGIFDDFCPGFIFPDPEPSKPGDPGTGDEFDDATDAAPGLLDSKVTIRVLRYIGALDTPPRPIEEQAFKIQIRIREMTAEAAFLRKNLLDALPVKDPLKCAKRYLENRNRAELEKQLDRMKAQGIPSFDLEDVLRRNEVDEFHAFK